MDDPIIDQVIEYLTTLPSHLQRQVLHFVKLLKLSTQQGVPGSQLLKFAGAIPAEDLEEMSEAIEIGCEQVEPDEW